MFKTKGVKKTIMVKNVIILIQKRKNQDFGHFYKNEKIIKPNGIFFSQNLYQSLKSMSCESFLKEPVIFYCVIKKHVIL